MIPVPSGVRVWIATGHTDMRRGMNSLALQIQQALNRDPHAIPGVAYPHLVEAAGRCPPEDIGGPWGYAELLERSAIPSMSVMPS